MGDLPEQAINLDVKEKKGISFNIFPLAFTCVKLLSSWLTLWGLGYYKLSPSWVALGAVGYFVYKRQLEKRAIVSSAMKAISANEKESIMQNIGALQLPSWVYFPDIERAEWLNKVIERLWPFITVYISEYLEKSVVPAVNNNLPGSLQPFKILKADLGDTPPRIGGVKVYTEEAIRRDEVVMDLDIMLYSDARIKVSVGKILAGVKNFELRGTLRVLMKPLVPKIPFAGAVTVCFLDNPYINFILTHLGNILTMPGLQQTLNRTIQDAVSSLCVVPNRITVSLVDDIVVEQLKFPAPQGVVRVCVLSASNLVASDLNLLGKDSSDPYCVVRVGAQKFTTAVKMKTLNPTWNETFEAIVDQRYGQSVQIEVWDEDKGSKDDELGFATIPLDTVHQRGLLDTMVVLEGVKKGKVHLKIKWLNLSSEPEDLGKVAQLARESTPSEQCGATNYLFVRIENCKNLMTLAELRRRPPLTRYNSTQSQLSSLSRQRLKFIQEPSPYCILQLGNNVQNTVVKEKTQNPVWESVHHFLFCNAEIETLNLEVRDSRTEAILGTLSIPLKHIVAEPKMTVTRPYHLTTSGADVAIITIHTELRALVPSVDKRPDSLRENSPHPSVTSAASSDQPTHSPRASPSRNGQSGLSMSRSDTKDLSNGVASDNSASSASPPPPDENVVRKRQLSDKNKQATGKIPDANFVVAPRDPVGRIRLTVHYNIELEIFEVTVHRAENLLGVEKDGLSDPYTKLSIIDEVGSVVGDSKKTKVVKNDLNPVFEECFDFSVKEEELSACKLLVEVKNHVGIMHRGKAVRSMGSVSIHLINVAAGGGFTEWYWMAPPS